MHAFYNVQFKNKENIISVELYIQNSKKRFHEHRYILLVLLPNIIIYHKHGYITYNCVMVVCTHGITRTTYTIYTRTIVRISIIIVSIIDNV